MAETTSIPSLSRQLPWLARHGLAYKNANGEIHVSLPERLPHLMDNQTLIHICKDGERLQDIAIFYYKDTLPSPVDYWEVIAQFQEDPILDGSTLLKEGTVLQIPSTGYMQQLIFGDSLSEYPAI